MKEIFIVEDDHDIREMIEYILVSQKYKVQGFPNAEKFKSKIKSSNPDLILMDVMLPDGNGQDLCRELCETENRKQIPIILMSAHTEPGKLKKSCAKDFISKPFDIKDFLERVKMRMG